MKSYPTVLNLPIILDDEPDRTPGARGAFAGLTSTDRAPREEILHCAYAIWESEGYPTNRQLSNWLEAEAEVMRRRS